MSSTPKKKWVKLEFQPNENWHPVRNARGDVLTCDYADSAGMIIAQFPLTMVVEEEYYTMIQDLHAKAKALPYARQQRDEAEDAERKLLARVDELEEKLKYFQLPNRC
jgi:hypothetical protein